MTKFFSFFRRLIPSFGSEPTYNHCQELVERSRNGDQVAIAIIASVRQNAEKGNEKALKSLEEIKRYARSVSPTTVSVGADAMMLRRACFGEDVDNVGMHLTKVAYTSPNTAAVTVANSCNAKELAQKLNQCMDSEAFRQTLKNPGLFLELMKRFDHDTQHALLLGYVMGMACRIQMVRNPKCPVSVISRMAAWELGQ